MSAVLLDTHALVWMVEDDSQLGPHAAQQADDAANKGMLLISAITFWEMSTLVASGRLSLTQPVQIWRQRVIELGVQEIPLSGEIKYAVFILSKSGTTPGCQRFPPSDV